MALGRSLLLAVAILVACVCSAYAVSVASPPYNFTGSGSTLAAPLYDAWAFDYQISSGIALKYVQSGSGTGVTSLGQGHYQFAGSDNPLTNGSASTQLGQFPDLIQFPTVAAPQVMVFNHPGIAGTYRNTLILDGPTLALIYMGDILYWNDTRLIAIQNDSAVITALENSPEAIITVARLDSSGDTGIFTRCMSSFSSQWASTFSSFSQWNAKNSSGLPANPYAYARSQDPNFVLLSQNLGIAGYVTSTKYSMGYVAYPLLANQNLYNIADMVNSAGTRLSANITQVPSFGSTLDNIVFNSQLITTNFTNSPAVDAWPMGGPTYVMLHTNFSNPNATNCESNRQMLLFWRWALTNPIAQQQVTFSGYSSLGTGAATLVLNYLEKFQCSNGEMFLSDIVLAQHTNKSAFTAIIAVTEVLAGICVAGVVFYLIRENRRIPNPALFFFGCLLGGAVLNYVSLGWWYVVPKSLWVCQLRQWFVGVGFALMFAAIFVRANQIQDILALARSSKLLASKGRQLRSMIRLGALFAVIIGIQIIILICWSAIDPWSPTINEFDDLRLTYTYICASKHNWVWFGLEIAFFSILLMFGMYVVYRSWDLKHLVVESKYIAVSVYNSVVIMIIVIILFNTLTPTDDTVYYIAVPAVAFLTTMLLVALMGPKLMNPGSASLATTTQSASMVDRSKTNTGNSAPKSANSEAKKSTNGKKKKKKSNVRGFHSNSATGENGSTTDDTDV